MGVVLLLACLQVKRCKVRIMSKGCSHCWVHCSDCMRGCSSILLLGGVGCAATLSCCQVVVPSTLPQQDPAAVAAKLWTHMQDCLLHFLALLEHPAAATWSTIIMQCSGCSGMLSRPSMLNLIVMIHALR